MQLLRILPIAAFTVMLFVRVPMAQIGRIAGQDWTGSGADAQRSSWIRTDAFISSQSMVKPEFKLQWKLTVDNAPRELVSLTTPATVTVSLMFKPLTVIGGSANTIHAVDNETGVLYWRSRFDVPASSGTQACPGGMTAAVARASTLTQLASGRAGGAARGRGPFTSGVGKPGEGVPAELMSGGMFGPGGGRGPAGPGGAAPGAQGGGAAPGPAGAAGPGRGTTDAPAGRGFADAPGRGPGGPGGPGGGRGGPSPVYALTSDGNLRTLGANSGKEVQRPVPFVPANAKASDLSVVENAGYVATSNDCGGVPNGVWAIDLSSDARAVTSWKTGGASPVGAPAFGSDGTLYVALGPGAAAPGAYANAIVALEPKTLAVKGWFTQPSTEFASAPIIFKLADKEIVAAGTRDGRIVLVDAGVLGGADHSMALHVSPPLSAAPIASGLATWEDPGGTRWLLLPAATAGDGGPGGVVAMRVTGAGGQLSLERVWTSRAMTSPAAPVVVNDVVFGLSTGRYDGTSVRASATERARRSTPAVIYALDARTGKELWNSGKTITSFVSSAGLWTSVGQVHVATHDGTLYTFGFPLERY